MSPSPAQIEEERCQQLADLMTARQLLCDVIEAPYRESDDE